MLLPHVPTTEAPQDHVMVSVLPGILYGLILEQTTVRPKVVVRSVPHLLAKTEHVTRPYVSHTWKIAMEEVLHHIL